MFTSNASNRFWESAMRVRLLLLMFVFSASSAWAADAPAATTVNVQADRTSPDFREGLSEGCEHASFGMTRNEPRFKTNINYHEGWVAGYKSCYAHATINTNGDPNGPMKNVF